MKKILVFFFLSFGLCQYGYTQIDIFTESFDESNGSTSGSSDEGVDWETDCPTCIPSNDYFEVVPGGLEAQDTNGPATFTTDDIDISNCSSITLTFDYEFSIPWEGPGSSTLEYCDEQYANGNYACGGLSVPGCNCDIDNPLNNSCEFCWDYLYTELYINGSQEEFDIIGDSGTTDAEISGTVSLSSCTLGDTDAFIKITTQFWGANEAVLLENLVLVCYENDPIATVDGDEGPVEVCEGQDIEFEELNVDANKVNEWSWSGPGGSVNGSNTFDLLDVEASDAGDYVVTVTDVNNCSATDDIELIVSSAPTAEFDLSDEEICLGECLEVELNFSGTAPFTVTFDGSFCGVPIPTTANLTFDSGETTLTICVDNQNTNLFNPAFWNDADNSVEVWSGLTGFPIFCDNGSIFVTEVVDDTGCINTDDSPELDIQLVEPEEADFSDPAPYCESDMTVYNLDNTDPDGITGSWDPDDSYVPSDLGVGTTTFTFTPDANQCAEETSIDIEVEAAGNPDFDAFADLCETDGVFTFPTNDNNSVAGTWSPDTVDPSTDGPSVTATFTASSGCFNTFDATIDIVPAPDAGLDGTLTVCEGTTPTDAELFAELGGTPDAGGVWTNVGTTYTYTVSGTMPCLDDTAEIELIENTPPDAGLDGTLTVCEGTTPTDAELFAELGGTPDAGGVWTNVGTTYTYTVTGLTPCVDATAEVEVTENPEPDAGLDGTLTVCEGTTPTDAELFAELGGTPDAGGVWTNVGTTYTYTVTGLTPCVDATAEIELTENPAPDAGLDGTLTVCEGTFPTDAELFAELGGTPDAGGVWSNVGNTHTYTVTGMAPCSDATAEVEVSETPSTVANFMQLGPYCQGDNPDNLLTTSLNGISGTWDPGVVDTSIPNSTIYIFTTSQECATGTTMEVVVESEIIPSFDPLGPYCVGDVPDVLPTISTNGVNGSWNGTIDTSLPGSTTYSFIPSDDCATIQEMDVLVEAEVNPDFVQLGPYCVDAVPDILPTQSVNGVNGTWNGPIETSSPGTTDYTFTPSDDCAASTMMTIVIDTEVSPTFTALGPYCVDETPDVLPTVSDNGLSGTWDGPISTTMAGTTTYTFSPDDDCAIEQTMMVMVVEEQNPVFDQLGPYCQNEAPDDLPTISTNGVEGTWDGPIDTSTPGTTIYNFTPDSDCATITTMNIEVEIETIPLFDQLGPYCIGDTPDVLPTSSTNGVLGSWNAPITTTTAGNTTYFFTSMEDCTTSAMMDVEVIDQLLPTFNQLGPYCVDEVPDGLPLISNNGVDGVWDGPIDTSTPGTTTYTFTPSDACAQIATMEVEIDTEVISVFDQLGPYCVDAVPDLLPTTSNNGFSGTWDGPIDTSTPGIKTYTFSTTEECALGATMNVEITNSIDPSFDQLGPYCQGDTPDDLPQISLNGISGSWDSPINTNDLGVSIYTFTPDDECANQITMSVSVTELLVAVFMQLGPYCVDAVPDVLPDTAQNGVEGTWDGPIDTSTPGTSTYTFTASDMCAEGTTMDIEVDTEVMSSFDSFGPYCVGETPDVLPTTSNNGFDGNWDGPIDTSVPGTTTYTFTTMEACAVGTTIDVTVESSSTAEAEFTSTDTNLCPGECLDVTFAVSGGNGGPYDLEFEISAAGLNFPFTIPLSTTSGMFTVCSTTSFLPSYDFATNTLFIPDLFIGLDLALELLSVTEGGCQGTVSSNLITINFINEINPDFDQLGPYCIDEVPDVLPLISTNDVNGNWDGPISTSASGVTTYTFTPTDACATIAEMDIEVIDPLVPDFDQLGPYCLNEAPDGLNTTSNNGVTGSWDGPIDTSSPGFTDYTFTPDGCATEFIMNVEVINSVTPEFDQIGPFCSSDNSTYTLSMTDNNGVTGSWSPDENITPSDINTGLNFYTFTSDNSCDEEFVMEVFVSDLTAGLGTVTCNDAGTPDADDDIVSFTLDPQGGTAGGSFTVSVSDGIVFPSSGLYGTISMYEITGTTAPMISITITDDSDVNCSITLDINNPAPCSSSCEIFNNFCLPNPGNPACVSGDPTGVNIIGSDEQVNMGGQVCISVTTNNFLDVQSIGMDIDFDPTLLSYNSAQNFCPDLTGFDANSVGITNAGSGQLTIVWFDLTGSNPVDLDCGKILFELCFDAIGSEGTIADIEFSDVEIGDSSQNPLPIYTDCGSIQICDGSNGLNLLCNDNGTDDINTDDFMSFDLNPMGDGIGTSYTVSVSSGNVTPTSGMYGVLTSFQMNTGSASESTITITIADQDEPSCFTEIVIEPMTCSEACDISYVLGNVICDNNNSSCDSSDDLFTYPIEISGINVGCSWVANDANSTTGNYTGEAVEFGPFPFSGGDVTITITDDEDPTCIETIMLPAISCSSNILSANEVDINCNDNGTPDDPLDDIFFVDIIVSTSEGGTTWSSDIGGIVLGDYDVVTVLGPFNIADGSFEINFTDNGDASCGDALLIEPPLPCSFNCTITPVVGNPICNDGGTPDDPSDDTFTFFITVEGTNTSNGWEFISGLTLSGPFDANIIAGPYPVGDGSIIDVTIADQADPNCTVDLQIDPSGCVVVPCSIEASITYDCNDNGTPTDPSDDLYFYDITVNGTNTTGGGWNSDSFQDGNLDETVSFGPFPIAGASDFVLNIFDDADPTCDFDLLIEIPLPCSDDVPCDLIDLQLDNLMCNDFDTPNDETDDFISFTLNPIGVGLGTTYSITPNTILPTTAAYGQETFFTLPLGSAGSGDVFFTITDGDDNSCSIPLVITDPGNCSQDCTTAPTAGSGMDTLFCGLTGEFDLFELLTGHDSGGVWSIDVTGINGSMMSLNLPPAVYTVTYTVAQNTACEESVSMQVEILGSVEILEFQISDCTFVVLPELTGINLSGNEAYYTQPFGNGIQYNEGDTIFETVPLFSFDSQSDCIGTATHFINIEKPAIDNPGTVVGCDFYILPEITGEFFTTTPGYFSEMDGMGQTYSVGDTFFTATDIYMYHNDGECFDEELLSIVIINGTEFLVDDEICPGQQIIINDNVYDENNLSGMETLVSSIGCDSLVTIELTVVDAVTSMLDTMICADEEFLYQGLTFDVDMPSGEFTFTNGSAFGCDSTVIINVEILEDAMSFLDTLLCADDVFIYQGVTYDIDNPMGEFVFDGAAANGCDSTVIITASFEEPNAEYSITTLEDDETQQINITLDITPTSILWSPVDFLSCTDCLNPTVNSLFDLEYTVTIGYGSSCEFTLTIPVQSATVLEFYVPNIFTPNGDGVNETFFVQGIENVASIEEFFVFDRWGEQVFSMESKSFPDGIPINNEEFGWDGTFKGEEVVSGVYVYMINLTDVAGKTYNLKGNVTVIF